MRKSIILFIAICQLSILNCHLSIAQNDTTLKRIVTVERDFQPVIQSAGKINQRPNILSTDIPLAPVIYSTYTAPGLRSFLHLESTIWGTSTLIFPIIRV